MDKFDDKKLEALLNAGKYDEAKAMVEAFFDEPMKTTTNADLALDYGHLYMKVMNIINERHLKSLRETASMLRAVDVAERKSNDSLQIARIKADLKG